MIFPMTGWIRNRLERLARGRALWRTLPPDLGSIRILVSPDARLQHLKWGETAFDSELLGLAREQVHEDTVVWDIGANIGVFSLAAASRVKAGCVVAVEPDPWLFGLLQCSCSRLNETKVHTLCAALADVPGVARLAIAQRGRASNFLERYAGRSQAGGVRALQMVPVLTLDMLADTAPSPTLVKIDVEGAEWAVLKGAEGVLTKYRPKIFVETDPETETQVIRYLESLDYSLRKTGSNLWAEPR